MKLLQYVDNWADEMDIDGIYIFKSEQEFRQFALKVEEIKQYINEDDGNEFTYCIGTNEDMVYSQDQSNIEDAYTVEEISNAEYEVLKKLDIESLGFAASFVENVLGFDANEL